MAAQTVQQQSPYAVPAVFLCGSPSSRRKAGRVSSSSQDAAPLPSIRRPISRESVEVLGKPRSATPKKNRQRNQIKDPAPALLDVHRENFGGKSPSMQSIHPTVFRPSPSLRRGTPEAVISSPVSSVGSPPGPCTRPPPPPSCSSPYSRPLRPGAHLRPVSRDLEARPVPASIAAAPRRLQSVPPIGRSARILPPLRNEDAQAPETELATRPRVSSPEARSCREALAVHRHINFKATDALASIHLINQELPADQRLTGMLSQSTSSQETEKTLSKPLSLDPDGTPYAHVVECTLSQPLSHEITRLQPHQQQETLSQPQPLQNNSAALQAPQVYGREEEKTLSQPLQKQTSLPQPAQSTANIADQTKKQPISPKAPDMLPTMVQTELGRTRPSHRQGLRRSLSTGVLLQ